MDHMDLLAALVDSSAEPVVVKPLTPEDEKLLDRLSKAVNRDEALNGVAIRQLVQPDEWQ